MHFSPRESILGALQASISFGENKAGVSTLLRFVICDDCTQHNETLERSLSDLISRHNLAAMITLVTTDPADVIDYAHRNLRDNVYFLDLDLGIKQTGLEVAQAIRCQDAHSYIVYISAHQEYLLDCMKSKASDFLIKPFVRAQLEQCVMGIFRDKALLDREPVLEVSIGSCTYFLPYHEIVCFEKQREYVLARLIKSQMRWREGYTQLLARLGVGMFVRVHHGYLVNLSHVASYNAAKRLLTVSTGEHLPVSRGYREAVERALRIAPGTRYASL